MSNTPGSHRVRVHCGNKPREQRTPEPPPTVGALLAAAQAGDLETVRRLLEHGVTPNACHKTRHSALSEAYASGIPQSGDSLVAAGATVGIVEAAYRNDIPLLTRFLDDGVSIETQNAVGATPLMAACVRGHREAAQFLLGRGADPNAENTSGIRPLLTLIPRERVQTLSLLVEAGADVNAVSTGTTFQETALQLAVDLGRTVTVAALLAYGANPNIVGRNAQKQAPLHKCLSFRARSIEVRMRIATLLLDAGADTEARDYLHYTPLMEAALAGEAPIVRLILERGADVRAGAPDGIASPLYNINRMASSNDKTESQALILQALGPEYAVYHAAERGDLTTLASLLDGGAPADQGFVFNSRLLNGPLAAETPASYPLSAAASRGYFDVVRLLLARGVSQRSKDKALFAAEREKHEAVADLLRAAGAINKLQRPKLCKTTMMPSVPTNSDNTNSTNG